MYTCIDYYIPFYILVNLLLERLHRGRDIADNCLMLAIRPLKIGGNIVNYFKYVPSYRYGSLMVCCL